MVNKLNGVNGTISRVKIQMAKRYVAIVGFVLFLVGLGLMAWFARGRASAEHLTGVTVNPEDNRPEGDGGEATCKNPRMAVSVDRQVMTENESQALTVLLSSDVACEAVVSLLSTNFDLSPASKQQVVRLAPNTQGLVTWVISPQKLGTFAIVLQVGSLQESVGMTVTNVLGFSAAQVQVFSIISAVFGPVLTVPWWVEQWQKRQEGQGETI